MTDYILLASMAAVVVMLLMLRTNTAIGYLALCSGSVLLLSSGENVGLVASSLTSGASFASSVAKIILLLTPLVVCSILLRKQLNGLMVAFGLIPAICIAFLGTVLTVPLLDEALRQSITETETWSLLVQYQEVFTGVGLVSSVLLLSLTVKRPHDRHGKKHH